MADKVAGLQGCECTCIGVHWCQMGAMHWCHMGASIRSQMGAMGATFTIAPLDRVPAPEIEVRNEKMRNHGPGN